MAVVVSNNFNYFVFLYTISFIFFFFFCFLYAKVIKAYATICLALKRKRIVLSTSGTVCTSYPSVFCAIVINNESKSNCTLAFLKIFFIFNVLNNFTREILSFFNFANVCVFCFFFQDNEAAAAQPEPVNNSFIFQNYYLETNSMSIN